MSENTIHKQFLASLVSQRILSAEQAKELESRTGLPTDQFIQLLQSENGVPTANLNQLRTVVSQRLRRSNTDQMKTIAASPTTTANSDHERTLIAPPKSTAVSESDSVGAESSVNASIRLDETPTKIGDYKIVSELGRGGMGVVYLAIHEQLKKKVAMKTMVKTAANVRGHRRFLQEGQTAARFSTHPNICGVVDAGETANFVYMALEYIDGTDLRALILAGKVKPKAGARVVADIAGALQFAHKNGVIHRDIKPANILVNRQSRAILTDFGIAKSVEAAEDVTQTGAVLGTLPYMAPEQAEDSKNVDERTDVYGLGAVLYEVLTGRTPHVGTTATNILMSLVKNDPPDPVSLNPAVDEELSQICMRALAKNPDARFQSAAELQTALDQYRFGQNPDDSLIESGADGSGSSWNKLSIGLGCLSLLLFVILAGTSKKLKSQLAEARQQLSVADDKSEQLQLKVTSLSKNNSQLLDKVNDFESKPFDWSGTAKFKVNHRYGPLSKPWNLRVSLTKALPESCNLQLSCAEVNWTVSTKATGLETVFKALPLFPLSKATFQVSIVRHGRIIKSLGELNHIYDSVSPLWQSSQLKNGARLSARSGTFELNGQVTERFLDSIHVTPTPDKLTLSPDVDVDTGSPRKLSCNWTVEPDSTTPVIVELVDKVGNIRTITGTLIGQPAASRVVILDPVAIGNQILTNRETFSLSGQVSPSNAKLTVNVDGKSREITTTKGRFSLPLVVKNGRSNIEFLVQNTRNTDSGQTRRKIDVVVDKTAPQLTTATFEMSDGASIALGTATSGAPEKVSFDFSEPVQITDVFLSVEGVKQTLNSDLCRLNSSKRTLRIDLGVIQDKLSRATQINFVVKFKDLAGNDSKFEKSSPINVRGIEIVSHQVELKGSRVFLNIKTTEKIKKVQLNKQSLSSRQATEIDIEVRDRVIDENLEIELTDNNGVVVNFTVPAGSKPLREARFWRVGESLSEVELLSRELFLAHIQAKFGEQISKPQFIEVGPATRRLRLPTIVHRPTGVEFVLIPGTQTKHKIRPPGGAVKSVVLELNGFWIARSELSWKQLRQVKKFKLTSDLPVAMGKEEPFPVRGLFRETCIKWLNAASTRAVKLRLPSMSEWQHAYRGGSSDDIYWNFANDFEKNLFFAQQFFLVKHIDKDTNPNGYGLGFMFGNVMEWCSDDVFVWKADKLTNEPLTQSRSQFAVVAGHGFGEQAKNFTRAEMSYYYWSKAPKQTAFKANNSLVSQDIIKRTEMRPVLAMPTSLNCSR